MSSRALKILTMARYKKTADNPVTYTKEKSSFTDSDSDITPISKDIQEIVDNIGMYSPESQTVSTALRSNDIQTEIQDTHYNEFVPNFGNNNNISEKYEFEGILGTYFKFFVNSYTFFLLD